MKIRDLLSINASTGIEQGVATFQKRLREVDPDAPEGAFVLPLMYRMMVWPDIGDTSELLDTKKGKK